MRKITRHSVQPARTLAALLLLFFGLCAAPLTAVQVIAVRGGTVYPISGSPIENGIVLIQDGRILAVGRNLEIPTEAVVLDASDSWITPGLINAYTRMGLVEIGAVSGTVESSNSKSPMTASFNVLEGVNPASQLIPVTRVEGITTVATVPRGGLIPGQSVVIDLAGERIEEMVVKSPAAIVLNLNQGSTEAAGGSRAEVMRSVRQLFNDALEYDRRRGDYNRQMMQQLAAPAQDLEALLPALRGELPLLVNASKVSDIENALRLAREYDLRIILSHAEEAWHLGQQLSELNVPVIIDPLANRPSYNALTARLDNAALLTSAGVAVTIANFDSHNARNVRQVAGNAVANGLGWSDALRAVTVNAAGALGIVDDYGTLEPGKVANLVVWDGDPFELSTTAEHVFIRGVEIPQSSRQRELLERYRTLPPSY